MRMTGTLYVVATPIGNLGDMVPRAVEILQTVALIAAEDTRHSGRLLKHLNIDTPMTPYHDRGDQRQSARILGALAKGEDVALISDAGTPLISDPGYKLVRDARQGGYTVSPIPGPCAAIAALSAAGLPSDRFAFEGFLPAKSGERRKRLETLLVEQRTLIFYEAPHRILDTLTDIGEVLNVQRNEAQRNIVLARELSKTFETFLSGSAAELLEILHADPNQQRGEFVLMIEGAPKQAQNAEDADVEKVLTTLIADLPLKQAVALAAKITGVNKNSLYQRGLELKAAS
ncbi:MAG: 16S rRNA (cytidine(1402)-2'-O)-methyltransferase [Porticoccaceae bacterium]